MRIVMTLLCRNEIDILQANLDFHLNAGVDYIIATDNASEDGSRELLQAYARKGVLTLIDEPALTHDQSEWVTRMARLAAAEYGADWIINSDADEFWRTAGADLKTILNGVDKEIPAISAHRYNFSPLREEYAEPFWRKMLFREVRSVNAKGRPLPPKICHRASPDITVADGNHHVYLDDDELFAPPLNELIIFHFPVRNYQQFERKIRLGVEALERNKRVTQQVGNAWRHLYHDYLVHGRLPEYFKGAAMTGAQIELALERGELVLDERLKDALSELYGAQFGRT